MAVKGIVNEVAPSQMAGLALTEIVGKGFTVIRPELVLALSQPFTLQAAW